MRGSFTAQRRRVVLAVLLTALDSLGRRLLVNEELCRKLPAVFLHYHYSRVWGWLISLCLRM